MGCSPSNSSSNKSDKDGSSSALLVQLVNPVNQQIVELKYNSLNSKREDYLMNIMNSLFFADDKNSKIDVCFNSLYNKKDDRFHYYLYRLLDIEMENIQQPYAGKMWVLYVQNKPMDWDSIVNSNQKFDFSKGGKVIWKYEKFSLASPEHLNIYHELSQEHNLDYLQNVGKYQSQISSESQSNILSTQKQSKITSNQLSQHIMQDKSTADHTQVSSQKRASQEVEELFKKKFNNAGACGLDAPSSLFNPEIQGNPNTKKLLVTESSHIYSNGINYLNTEDEVRQIQPPLHTEACPIENSDYRNVFDTQNNDDSVVPDKNLLQSFNGTRKSYQVPGGSIYQRNSGGNKEQLNTIPSDRRKEPLQSYFDGDENIKSEKESSRKHPTNQESIQKNLQCSNTQSYKFQENCDYNQTIELNRPK